MKDFLKKCTKIPMLWVLVLIIFVYTFSALGASAEINTYAIVTAIGIDASEEEDSNFEVSLLTFVPIAEQTFTEKYKVVSAKGRSISEAMDFAGLHIGRQVGLSHVKIVILNTKLVTEDVSKFLDFLSRSKQMAASTKLIATDSPAKDFLNSAKKLDSESSIKISELITFNLQYIYATDSTFETFFKGLFGPTKVSLVPFLTIDKKLGDGIAVAATDDNVQGESGGGGDSSGGGGSESKEEIVNNGDTLVFKNGKAISLLSGKELKKINLIRGNFKTGSIEIENFVDENFDNANLIFDIFDKTLQFKVVFENGIPVVYIDTSLTLMLTEVDNNQGIIQENVEFYVITKTAINQIEKKVRNSMADAIEIMRNEQADIVDFYTIIHNSNKSAFYKFLNNLDDKDNYLNHVVFKIGVRVYSK